MDKKKAKGEKDWVGRIATVLEMILHYIYLRMNTEKRTYQGIV